MASRAQSAFSFFLLLAWLPSFGQAQNLWKPMRLPEDKANWEISQPEKVGEIPFRISATPIAMNFGDKAWLGIGLGNVKRMHFLVSSGGDLIRGEVAASITVLYESGKTEVLPLISGKNTYYAGLDLGVPRSLEGRHLFSWENPSPGEAILLLAFEGLGKTTGSGFPAVTSEALQEGFVQVAAEKVTSALRTEAEKEKTRKEGEKKRALSLARQQVDQGKFKPVALNFKQRGWQLVGAPVFPMQLWVVKSVPFLSDGNSLSVGNPSIPYRGLSVNLRNVRTLRFLHWGGGGGVEYRMFYSDGTSASLHVKRGNELQWATWYSHPRAVAGSPEGAYVSKWENPYPEKALDWIDIVVPDNGGIQVVAITAEAEGKFAETPPEEGESRFQKYLKALEEKELQGKVLEWEDLPGSRRPLLLFGTSDLPGLRRKSKQGVLAKYYQWLNGRANEGIEGWGSTHGLYYNCVSYLMTGDTAYAGRAKEFLLKGCEFVLKTAREGPNVCHTGRLVPRLCLGYDIVASGGVLTAEEDLRIKKQLALITYKHMDKGYFNFEEPDEKIDNFNTDRLVAVGAFALTFPKHPLAREWLAHCLQEVDYQLANMFPSGAWPESLGYHYHVLKGLQWLGYALKKNQVRDLFADERFKRFIAFSMLVQTYPDADWGKHASKQVYTKGPMPKIAFTPALGDVPNSSAGQFFLFSAASACKKTQREFAGNLMWSWDAAGKPIQGGEEAPFLEWMGEESIKRVDPKLKSMAIQDIGYAFLREPSRQMLVCFLCGPHCKHHHNDKGSFVFQAFNHMLTIDPGTESYGTSWHEWYGQPWAHNTLTFDFPSVAHPADRGKMIRFQRGRVLDYVAGEMTGLEDTAKVALWRRHLVFVKPFFLLVWDQLKAAVPAEWNYHPLALSVENDGDCFNIRGTWGVDTRLTFLSPALTTDKVVLSEDTPHWTTPDEMVWGKARWIKVRAAPGEEFLAVLYPYQGKSSLKLESKGPGRWRFSVEGKTGEIVKDGADLLKVIFNGESVSTVPH